MAIAARTVELRLMGEPALLVEGRAASFAGFPRLPALLAFLALNDAPVRRDRLAFALWPDDTESAARANLRRTLHRLQALLGAHSGMLDVTTTHLALRRDAAVCDLWELQRVLDEPALSDEAIAGALHAYAGGLLPALEDEWLAPLRDRLRSRLVSSIDAAMQRAVNDNDPAAVQRRARALLSLDPFREEALRALMNALAQSGDRGGALSEYRAFAQRLHEEFQVQPDAATTEVYETLAKGAAARRTHNLPFETDPFIGRVAELARIERAYETRRAVTICGAPGVGKSRLALHYAHAHRGKSGEAWYVQLGPAKNRRDVVDALLAVLRIAQQPREEPFEALCRGLAERDVLLYLDTAEHLVADAGDLIESLLEQCAGVRALVTSRTPLKIPGEAVTRIEPLPIEDAKRLLADRATAAAGSHVALEDGTLTALCTALEGVPLAIELAAARASAFPLAEIARRAGGHKTLDETIGWSYALLAPFEQQCLRALAVFEESWTLQAAGVVCCGEPPAIETAVASLVDKSFAHCIDARSGRRYALYQSVRDFALARTDTHERDAATAAFIAYYRELAETLAPQLTGARQSEALDILHDERSNIGAVLRYADEAGAHWGAPFALALYRYWLTRGSYVDALHWMERFSEVAADPSARAQCCADAAVLSTLLGDVKHAQQLLECAQESGDIDDAAKIEVHHAAGVMAHERGDLRKGREAFVASLDYARRVNDEAKIARALDNIGTEDTLLEDFESARVALEESLATYRRLGGVESVAWVLYHLAGLAFESGDYERAVALNAESFEIRRALDHRYGIALCHEGMGKAKFALGRFEEAQQDYVEALRLWHDGNQRSSVGLALESLAAIAVRRGQYERAGLLSQAADRLRADLAIEMRPYERHLREAYHAQAARENADAFNAGRARALTLSEARCVQIALS